MSRGPWISWFVSQYLMWSRWGFHNRTSVEAVFLPGSKMADHWSFKWSRMVKASLFDLRTVLRSVKYLQSSGWPTFGLWKFQIGVTESTSWIDHLPGNTKDLILWGYPARSRTIGKLLRSSGDLVGSTHDTRRLSGKGSTWQQNQPYALIPSNSVLDLAR